MKDCNEIARGLLARRDEYRKKQRRRKKAAIAAAACFCLIAGGCIGLWRGGVFSPAENSGKDSSPPAVHYEGYALSIPPIVLPETEEGVSSDMIGLVVYKGGIYTQAEDYLGDEAEAIKNLVGEYLGHASGTIDEWSSQNDYAEEFASTYTGDVYSVNGYSTDFRICICQEVEGENGEAVLWIQFLERLNGIGITYGGDIFKDRLKMPGNWSKVEYISHSDWDMGGGEYVQIPGVTPEDIDAFISQLCSGKFEYAYETYPEIYSDEALKQGHLKFSMADGTEAELRLIEGGYVGYQHMGWYFVKMPGEIFDKVFDAIT